MDYVVAGFGIGAILALIGSVLWELFGNSEEPGQSWLSRAAIGSMIGALVIWSVTGVSLFSTIDDSTGSRLVLVTTLVTLVAIAAGSFWYWRADQALLATMPRQRRVAKPKAESTMAADAPGAAAEVDLSEWDSWPERQNPSPVAEATGNETVADVSFEPEVAAKAALAASEAGQEKPEDPEIDDSAEMEDEETVEKSAQIDADTPAAKTEPEPEPAKNQGDASENEDSENAEGGTDKPHAGEVDADSPETDNLAIDDSETKAAGSPVAADELPANVRPFRAPAQQAPGKVVPTAEPDVEEPANVDPVAEIDETAEVRPPAAKVAQPQPDKPSVESAAFESSLLADIDVNALEGDGRYRSPLLADLEVNPDELERTGLAKWRPDARLIAEEQPEKKVQRGR